MLEHDEIKQMHESAYTAGYDVRQRAVDDTLFAWVTQWDDTYLAESDLEYRGEFNVLRKAMRQILTDLVINPIQVDFDPVDETAEQGSEIMDGMFRASCRSNTSLEASKNCNQETVVCGVGAWKLSNEYKTNRYGDDEQVIVRSPVYEAATNLLWDPNAKLLDKSDADFCSLLTAYSEDAYKELVKELTGEEINVLPSFSTPDTSFTFPWLSADKKVYVCEFYHRKLTTVNYITFSDSFGTTRTIKEDDVTELEDELVDGGFNFESERKIKRYEVTRYLVDGIQVLETTVVPGEHIPIIPQYGERSFVEGVEYYEGIVRLAKDPQRLRNFQLSYLATIVSQSPREKPIFTAEQVQGFEDMYEASGADNNLPYLLQNANDANGNPLPVGATGYIKAPEVPPALMMSIGESRLAIDDVAGSGLPQDITDTSLSGKAIMSLQKRMDMQSYTYQDNHKFAWRRDGEVFASMSRDVMDSHRTVSIAKVDGTTTTEEINKPQLNQLGEMEIVNDVTEMIFDVYADIGPAFESVKEQNKEEVKELLNGVPPGTPTYNLLLNQYLTMVDGVAFDDLRDYARKQLILMGVKEPETDEEKAMLEQAQQAQQEQVDPAMMLEMKKAEAEILREQNRAKQLQIDVAKLEQSQQQIEIDKASRLMNVEEQIADIAKTKADTLQSLAKTDQLTTDTFSSQINNMQQISPQF